MGRAQQGTRRGRAIKLVAPAALLVPFMTGCTAADVLRFGWPEGVTPQAEAMRDLWTWSAVAALIVGAVTWGAMFWAVAFHRKRKDDDGSAPRQTQYNLPVEIVFTVIPTVIVAVLFAFTVIVQNYVDTDEADPDLAVDIRGFQWNWQFTYPDTQGPDGEPVTTIGDSDTIPLLVLPTGQRIQFTQASTDVIHSFFVPEFLFKRDVFPMPERNNQDNVWQISSIDREGNFVGRCAELCGSYHSMMNFEVRALPPALFDQYLEIRGGENPATREGYTAGEALQELQGRGCDPVLCSPTATETVPYDTDRTAREPSGTIAAGN